MDNKELTEEEYWKERTRQENYDFDDGVYDNAPITGSNTGCLGVVLLVVIGLAAVVSWIV